MVLGKTMLQLIWVLSIPLGGAISMSASDQTITLKAVTGKGVTASAGMTAVGDISITAGGTLVLPQSHLVVET